MNSRRGFLRTLLAAGAGFAIVPTFFRRKVKQRPAEAIGFAAVQAKFATNLKALDEKLIPRLLSHDVIKDPLTGFSFVHFTFDYNDGSTRETFQLL